MEILLFLLGVSISYKEKLVVEIPRAWDWEIDIRFVSENLNFASNYEILESNKLLGTLTNYKLFAPIKILAKVYVKVAKM